MENSPYVADNIEVGRARPRISAGFRDFAQRELDKMKHYCYFGIVIAIIGEKMALAMP